MARNGPLPRALLVISDVIATSISVVVTYFIRTEMLSNMPFVKEFFHDITTYLKTIPFIAILWILIFAKKGLYRPRRGLSGMGEFREIVGAITLGVVIIMAASFLRKFDYSRLIVLTFWVSNIVLLGLSRALLRHIQKRLMARGKGQSRVIMVGTGEMASLVVERMKKTEGLGYKIIGVVDDEDHIRGRADVWGVQFLGNVGQLPELIRELNAQEVFFAKPKMEHRQILNIVAKCGEPDVSFRIVSDLFEIVTGKTDIDNVADTPIIDLAGPRIGILGRISKTVMDYVIASVLMLLSLPLWLVISVAIKLDTKGSILFRQARVGKKGKEFTIYKFRTMFTNVNAFEHSPTHKEDQRITRIGKVLRRTSLDELPQLLNVLKGEMSLVGPRPEMPFIVRQYDEWQHKRLDVKPGITGLWQVLGRKELRLEDNLQYDFYYIKNRSILMDLVILFKTVGVVIIGKGAF